MPAWVVKPGNALLEQEGVYWYRLTAWNAYGWSEDVIAGPCVITHVPELCDEDICMAYTDCKGQPGHSALSAAGLGLPAGALGAPPCTRCHSMHAEHLCMPPALDAAFATCSLELLSFSMQRAPA
jgi:hypothetical protein